MIKIDLHNEKQILDFHYTNLTTQKNQEKTIEMFLNERIKNCKGTSISKKKKLYKRLKNLTIKRSSNSFSILTAKPNELDLCMKKIESRFKKILNLEYSKSKSGISISVRSNLLKIFYYESYEKWQAYELAKKIGIKVCPYCNRNYTFIVGNDYKKGTRFQYDHFFDKASYPYLALSFYNLVPSCNTCNSDLKGSDKFTLRDNFHPYIEGFSSDLLFSIKAKNVDFINGNPSAYRIKFKLNKKSTWDKARIKAAFRNINIFRLTELYNMHKDYVNEILQKAHVYDSGYMEDLFKNYPDLFGSIDDVKRMVLGNYTNESDFSKRPLSKLTSDISKELKIID